MGKRKFTCIHKNVNEQTEHENQHSTLLQKGNRKLKTFNPNAVPTQRFMM